MAWDALTSLFEILRGEQDEGHLAAGTMNASTAWIVTGISAAEQKGMIKGRKVDRTHPTFGPLGLRDTLNKIAHYQSSAATFRVDRRGAHYLVLGGKHLGKLWVAEILVSKLCKNGTAAIQAIAEP